MQSYKSYYMVSPQTVFTYPFHHAKLQILLHGVTTNSLYLSFSPCKGTNLTTWCHRKQSLLILVTMQSYKSYYTVSPQTVFTYPCHHAELQNILLHGVTANSLYLSLSPCRATNITTWCHCKQSLLILVTMQSYKYYYMVSLQTVFTYPCPHAELQILLHFTTNSLYLSFSMQELQILLHGSPLTVWTYPFHHAKVRTTWMSPQTVFTFLVTMQSYKSYYTVCHHKQSLLILVSPCKAAHTKYITTRCHQASELKIFLNLPTTYPPMDSAYPLPKVTYPFLFS